MSQPYSACNFRRELIPHIGVWRSPVARFVRDEEVGSSNLPAPTVSQWQLAVSSKQLVRRSGYEAGWHSDLVALARPGGYPLGYFLCGGKILSSRLAYFRMRTGCSLPNVQPSPAALARARPNRRRGRISRRQSRNVWGCELEKGYLLNFWRHKPRRVFE